MTQDVVRNEQVARRIEWFYFAAAFLVVVLLHVTFLQRSGSLWRDEINSVNIARVASWRQVVANLEYDSFPAGWFAVLRPLALHSGPASGFPFRVFGVTVGLLLALAVAAAGFDMTGRPPILAVNLLLLNAVVIRFGDSVRGYGVGMLFATLVYWSLWRYARHRTFAAAGLALLASAASVQLLYYNAFVVFGCCCAAAVACLMQRARWAAAGSIAIGAASAITLLPYLSVFQRARTWNDLVRFDIGLDWIRRMGAWSIERSGRVSLFLWYLAIAVALCIAAALVFRAVTKKPVDPATAFHAVALILGGASYIAFLRALSYYMAPWYYLALFVLIALAADALCATGRAAEWKLVVVILLCTHLTFAFGIVSRYVAQAATNVPDVAASVARQTTAQDLVIVSPWELGVAWQVYFNGAAPWVTIPPMSFLEWHRYDLYYEQLRTSAAAVDAVIRRADECLAANHRVVLITGFEFPTLPGPQPKWLVSFSFPSSRGFAHFQSDRYRISAWPQDGDAIGYERVTVLEFRRADQSH